MFAKMTHRALLGALLLGCAPVWAAGFVALPEEGFPIEGEGVSSYTVCNVTGAFGTDEEGSIPPTFEPNGGANNTCAIPSLPAGYKQIKNAKRPIVLQGLNNRSRVVKTTIGSVTDRVWRNDGEGSCIYGAKVKLNNVDADRRVPGKQFFEVNDIVRGGFDGLAPEAAYWFSTNADEVVYRVGLTATSLVFEPEAESDAQPPIEDAPIDPNWVDFSTDLNYRDDDGSSYRDSPWLLVKTPCGAGEMPAVVPGALKFRQMGQEGQPFVEVKVNAFAPQGSSAQ